MAVYFHSGPTSQECATTDLTLGVAGHIVTAEHGENSERRVWFILDEAPSLQRIPELAETLAEARKFGGCFVLGMQNMAQLVHVYGRELAKASLT